jgi:hypothetical protein
VQFLRQLFDPKRREVVRLSGVSYPSSGREPQARHNPGSMPAKTWALGAATSGCFRSKVALPALIKREDLQFACEKHETAWKANCTCA